MSKGLKVRVWWNDDENIIRVPFDGEKIIISKGGPHEEGWSSEEETYWIEDDEIFVETVHDGRDCDGPLTSTYIHRAPIVREGLRVYRGEWEKVSAWQRDVYAERMNY